MATAPLFVSSGDLIIDRRYQWALEHLRRGEMLEAVEILRQVVDAAPRFATAWFALASLRERIGDHQGAIAAFTAARDCDSNDYHGARLHLARLGVGEATPAMTAVYVQRMFDHHAKKFDEALVQRLDYRAPDILKAAVALVRQPLRFGSVLDLGCGTGLAGAVFRPFCERLIGVDVSSGMIDEARGKALYDELVVAELMNYLTGATGAQHDLVLAADVFVYCNDLAPIAVAVANMLVNGGLFAFTVETHAGDGVLLGETLRYAHGAAHVRAAIGSASLELVHLAAVSTRTEKGEPVDGLVVVARR